MSNAPRFTPDELIDIIDGTRFRTSITRDSGPDHDRIDVPHPYKRDCLYRFARDSTGWTYLLRISPDEYKMLVGGKLSECLALLRHSQP